MRKLRSGQQNRQGSGSHNTVIFVIVLLAFIGSSLLFWRVNTGVLRRSIEAETNLYAAFLAEDILNEVPDEESFKGTPGEELTEVLGQVSESLEGSMENSSIVWILDKKGNILARSTQHEESSAFERAMGRTDDAQESHDIFGDKSTIGVVDADKLAKITKDGVGTVWIGSRDLILLRQKCCVVRPLYDGALYIAVENLEDEAMALQRRQFSLLLMIDLLLMLVMIILIVNNNAKFRREIIRMATTDELTGLANRKSFNLEFEERMSSDAAGAAGRSGSGARLAAGQEAAFFLLDIDYFKQINDNYGHTAGDKALAYLGRELQDMVRRLGGFAGRWGGDEFIGVVFLPAETVHEELKALCRRVAAQKMEDGFSMTISAGVSAAHQGDSLSGLTEKADLALYECKENGRNQACLYREDMASPEAPEAASGKYSVEAALAEAEHMSLPTAAAATAAEAAGAAAYAGGRDGGSLNGPTLNDGAGNGTFRERLNGYIREKLIMSTILGVRWMAPFIAGGGILIALAFLFDSMSVDLNALSVAERAHLGSITTVAATLKDIGGITFNFMLPVFAGFMAYGIAGEEAFMAGFAGGYMVIGSNSGFVGAMCAGFIAGVITNEMQQFTGNMPGFLRKAAPIIIIPVFNLLLMQLLSVGLITPVASAIGEFVTGILERVVASSHLAGSALIAMMMATDMGGIINKVGYNYGVNSITTGNTDFMAAVMIGGMVPPIGIFLSTMMFPQKYTEAERDRGPGTLCMGLAFITEGALPYVFTDVLRVIPSCMLGSAVAGFMSAALGCTLPAPHGGIFVFPVMGHPLFYCIALFVGSMVTAVVLGMWKKGEKKE